ncbi:uncharacterized protein MKK02DRAFT_28024 [Dioszegia hungarica]|uniref:DUF7598 domain-containing protein n=1 Tax=Dioszegia hungarica TaxID=4972 RepID=A0AA38H9G9_9TREE|nr:uncharacterized protein MKK02DRAFT_28024 [Dioszegia hungarica]KAI9634899.1 hypothetical protein MKK02DRAFT_28024 [Dioszegia hungarica]
MSNLTPFLPSRPSGVVFISLNVLRVLSILALTLVLSANIVTMAKDIKAIKNPAPVNDDWDCEYYEYSTVPDQTGGPFWSVLHRIFITLECLVLIMSEMGIPRSLFESFLPILGPGHGLGCLGVFQALIATQMLSHYCELFPQATSWLLFIVGCFNAIAGIVFRQKAKERRLIFSWENASSSTPQTRMAATAWDMVHPPSPSHSRSNANANAGGKYDKMTDIPLSRSSTAHSAKESPLLPPGVNQKLGERFAGLQKGIGAFGFGKQATGAGVKISRPMETLPRYGN